MSEDEAGREKLKKREDEINERLAKDMEQRMKRESTQEANGQRNSQVEAEATNQMREAEASAEGNETEHDKDQHRLWEQKEGEGNETSAGESSKMGIEENQNESRSDRGWKRKKLSWLRTVAQNTRGDSN